jgi:predicted MFS family arabinose efflux permease
MAPAARSTLGTTAIMCVAELLTMTGFSTYPALVPVLQAEWRIDSAAAGVVSGALFLGYMLAVPVLSGLTDRIAPARVYVASCALLAAGSAGFALAARGTVSGAICQAIVGAGLAGTYMPGLRLLLDEVTGSRTHTAIAVYTSTFALGSSLSLVIAASTHARLGWRLAFVLAAMGPIVAAALVAWNFRHTPPRASAEPLAFGPVFRDRSALAYIAGYAAHCFELFAVRSWLAAFFVFAGSGSWSVASAARSVAAINLLGPVASIAGNELAVRGRGRFVVAVMLISAALSLAVGAAAGAQPAVVAIVAAAYFFAVAADSAALTTGIVRTSNAATGVTLAVYSFFGFGAAFVGPTLFGVVLDLAGGVHQPRAWLAAFALLSLVSLIGAASIARGLRGKQVPLEGTQV